jgi:hypothetical protein
MYIIILEDHQAPELIQFTENPSRLLSPKLLLLGPGFLSYYDEVSTGCKCE